MHFLRPIIFILTLSACAGPRLPAPVPDTGPVMLLTANERTSLTFTKEEDITVELRTSSNTKSCWVLAPIETEIPTGGKITFSPSDSLYPKTGKSVKILIRCVSKNGRNAETSLLIEHK